MSQQHTFHIPVMGIGFTIDTPLKVSQYGIDSVISLVDDGLMEKLRKMYCEKFNRVYEEISDIEEDYRAKRITSYLDLIHDLCTAQFDKVLASGPSHADYRKYLQMLPNNAAPDNLTMGSIDVNIMTKVDKANFRNKEKLPQEYNDAHSAVRGYANSKLNSSLVLSAGMNPRLYSYLENFEDFFADSKGRIKKKIVLKVSDYRSALIQGKFLAKKGLWVSEYRIESGLNCGGHAFATDGFLMGPILEEFKQNRKELEDSVFDLLQKTLSSKEGKKIPRARPSLKITAQGGVGTSEEHQFLLENYELDSIGWGTPFLLVPEATTVDYSTVQKMVAAKEKDLYLSKISPLGIRFNNLRDNTKDLEKEKLIKKGRPGSSCPKRFLALNNEFKETGICTASRQYQDLKIKELNAQDLSPEEYVDQFQDITEKSCICVGLGTSALIRYDLDRKKEGAGVSICPGPNMAYFSKTMTLEEITDHIYGRNNVIERTDRPHFLIKELSIYLDYLKDRLVSAPVGSKEQKLLTIFIQNLTQGVQYYNNTLLDVNSGIFNSTRSTIKKELDRSVSELDKLNDMVISKFKATESV